MESGDPRPRRGLSGRRTQRESAELAAETSGAPVDNDGVDRAVSDATELCEVDDNLRQIGAVDIVDSGLIGATGQAAPAHLADLTSSRDGPLSLRLDADRLR